MSATPCAQTVRAEGPGGEHLVVDGDHVATLHAALVAEIVTALRAHRRQTSVPAWSETDEGALREAHHPVASHYADLALQCSCGSLTATMRLQHRHRAKMREQAQAEQAKAR